MLVGLPSIGVKVSYGKLNFGDDAMAQICGFFDTKGKGSR